MSSGNTNIDEKGIMFGKWMLVPNIWAITNRWQNFMYLIIGTDKAMLIDSGYGEGDLRQFVEEITDKPVMVVNTHGHFDHTGGNAWWEDVWMTRDTALEARRTFSPIQEEWLSAKPHKDYKEHYVSDGDILDIGGREIEVIEIPAHNEGSIALLDKKNRLLFVGDELEGGQVLLFARQKNISLKEAVSAHKKNMLRLLAKRSEYDFICPAHNGVMLLPDPYLNDFITLSDNILSGLATYTANTAGFGFPPDVAAIESPFSSFGALMRADFGVASFVFQKTQL